MVQGETDSFSVCRFKGKRDELIYDEEKIEAISSLNNFAGNYLKLMFLEDKKDDNHLSISLEK